MNIALILQNKLWVGLQQWMGNALPSKPSRVGGAVCFAGTRAGMVPAVATSSRSGFPNAVRNPAPARHALTTPMPLRVVREIEKGQPRCSSGRMVISGRMADVCAELDRLAAREATLH